jgi:hypothetical protein
MTFWILSGIAYAVIVVIWVLFAVKVSKEAAGSDDIDDPYDYYF